MKKRVYGKYLVELKTTNENVKRELIVCKLLKVTNVNVYEIDQ